MIQGQILSFAKPNHAAAPSPDEFEVTQRALAHFNRQRLAPGLGEQQDDQALSYLHRMETLERSFVEDMRRDIQPLLAAVPRDGSEFVRWFEGLRETGPGQHDPLFPWLANEAAYADVRWFIEQEVAGEAGFDDLVALTQVKMPVRPKLEMARNFWDEMGRGDARGMHGPMLEQLAAHLQVEPVIETTVPEALSLANMMVALAFNRRYAFHAVGALGVIEMTAPARAECVSQALSRLKIPRKQSHYFDLHAVLDVKHSAAWNEEVLRPLVEADPRRARAIAEGAVLRLMCGARCFLRYRSAYARLGKTIGGH